MVAFSSRVPLRQQRNPLPELQFTTSPPCSTLKLTSRLPRMSFPVYTKGWAPIPPLSSPPGTLAEHGRVSSGMVSIRMFFRQDNSSEFLRFPLLRHFPTTPPPLGHAPCESSFFRDARLISFLMKTEDPQVKTRPFGHVRVFRPVSPPLDVFSKIQFNPIA